MQRNPYVNGAARWVEILKEDLAKNPDNERTKTRLEAFEDVATLIGNIAAETPDRWDQLKELCGHLGDGSQTTVKLYQDDATRTYHVSVGAKSFYGDSFEEVLAKAVEAQK